jgi:excisionase family DNA binding protein
MMNSETMQQEEQLLTVSEVAARLSLVPPTVYRLIWRGALPSVRIGRAVRVRCGDVRAFIESHTTSASQ